MRLVFVAVVIAGLGLSGGAVLMARDWLATQAEAAQAPDIPLTRVVVVARDVAYGEALSKDDLKFAMLPTEVLPAGTFSTAEELFSMGLDMARSVLRAMARNEPVPAPEVTQPGVDAGVAARLAEGLRAFAIGVDVASGVSGFRRPNDRVAIFWTGTLPGRKKDVTTLIDTNVRIVASTNPPTRSAAAPWSPARSRSRRRRARSRPSPGRDPRAGCPLPRWACSTAACPKPWRSTGATSRGPSTRCGPTRRRNRRPARCGPGAATRSRRRRSPARTSPGCVPGDTILG